MLKPAGCCAGRGAGNSGYTVSITNTTWAIYYTVTDALGKYNADNLVYDSYDTAFSKPGYRTT